MARHKCNLSGSTLLQHACNDHCLLLLLCPLHVTDFNTLWATVTMANTRACGEWRTDVVQSSDTFLDQDNCIIIVYLVMHETYPNQENKTKYLQRKECIKHKLHTLLRTYSYTAAAHMRYVLITKTINSCGNLIYTRVATQESTFCKLHTLSSATAGTCRFASSNFSANETIHTSKPWILYLYGNIYLLSAVKLSFAEHRRISCRYLNCDTSTNVKNTTHCCCPPEAHFINKCTANNRP